MALNIIVCIKQVPDPEHFDKISIDTRTGSIQREGILSITNPLDRNAIEEALRKKEEFGGTVTVLTMGPPQAKKSIEDALAMGADKGVILCDMAFAGADTLSTARVLSVGIRSLGDFDLIFCGNETVDGATGHVAAQLAEFLDIPHVTFARRINIVDEETAMVERSIENGYLKVEVKLPAVISVLKSINKYRLPTVMGIMEAAGKEIVELGCSVCESAGITEGEIGIRGSPTKVLEIFEPPQRREVEMIEGKPEEIARRIVKRLHELEAL
ncbi:MAG: electron transfer flavoprotein subunit beta/FixA family protein [Thermodesulfobacteriota bacterium]|nr:electron transfer flavoprotein subunit beta/FixA family protein [Thermodesulfobacteriota bacterium]